MPDKIKKAETFETLRRLRKRDLTEYRRRRYGNEFPDDDAGRADLIELLKTISLGPDPERRMCKTIEVDAPWIKDPKPIIDDVMAMSWRDRWPSAKYLGCVLNITNEQRECWRLWRIHPCDMTDAQMAEHRKAKNRARMLRNRQQAGAKPRSASLANKKPWKTKGQSRATWFRKRHNGRETNSCALNTYFFETHETVSRRLSKPRRPKKERARSGCGLTRRAN